MAHDLLLGAYGSIQLAYFCALAVVLWFFSLRVDTVTRKNAAEQDQTCPPILLLYPVLRELEATMRTTLLAVAQADYPADRLRVVAIPNHDDAVTIQSLRHLSQEFPFLEILAVPPTSDDSWKTVWRAWDSNPKAYWWHQGKRARVAHLPAKKTRQLVYAVYNLVDECSDALLTYLDADSVVPVDYFQTAAVGIEQYDVVQNTNLGGNLLHTLPASMFAMDHLSWDGSLYAHMTAGGKHPFYTLGKGLFMRFGDLVEVGCFNPWLTIEDPEIGMRLWTNGRRLGVVRNPLIEEVPLTLGRGITQRKRWAAGFYQSLASPLKLMGMTARQRMRARLNLVPCLSLFLNPIGLGIGVATLAGLGSGGSGFRALPLLVLTIINIVGAVCLHIINYRAAWLQTRAVLSTRRERLYYMLRVNPLFLMLHWMYWTIPLAMGFHMYLTDRGLTWEPTKKTDANHQLVRDVVLASPGVATVPGGGMRAEASRPRQAGSPIAVRARQRPTPRGRPSRYAAPASILACAFAVAVLIGNAASQRDGASIAADSTRNAGAERLLAGGLVGLERPSRVVPAGPAVVNLVLGGSIAPNPTPAPASASAAATLEPAASSVQPSGAQPVASSPVDPAELSVVRGPRIP
ncbi:MAG: glycosyltransferase family 2 protein [Solirubrobacteraceae bacterium]